MTALPYGESPTGGYCETSRLSSSDAERQCQEHARIHGGTRRGGKAS